MANLEPHMPEVDILSEEDAEKLLIQARQLAAKVDENGRCPVVITPSHHMLFPLGSVRPNSMPPEQVAPIEQLAPRNPPLNITVIALNTLETLIDDGWKRSIPFAGYLLGLAYIGHNIIVTEGHPSILAAVCKGADLLIVDGGMVPFLQADWPTVVRMSGTVKRMVIFGRDGTLTQLAVGSSDAPAQPMPSAPTPEKKPWWKLW